MARAAYILKAVLSVPPWVKRAEFKPLEWRRDELSFITGVEHVLDHIVPLSHPLVCGLTVPWNMEPVPRHVNGFKGNKFAPDQLAFDFTVAQTALWREYEHA